MRRSQRIFTACLIVLAVIAAMVVGLGRLRSIQRQQDLLIISTGTEGGTYIRAGLLLAHLLEDYSGPEIGAVQSVPSQGSIQNLRRLESSSAAVCETPQKPELALPVAAIEDLDTTPGNGEPCAAHLAFTVGPLAAGWPNVRALMVLYADVLQLVVRKDAGINSLEDLNGARVFVGPDGGGTPRISVGILNAVNIEYETVIAESFNDASEKLISGEADAAFFLASVPVQAVSSALATGCCILLNVEYARDVASDTADELGLRKRDIPVLFYENQPDAVHTVEAPSLLVGRADLDDNLVRSILSVIFDHLDEFAIAHIRAHEIKLWKAFDDVPNGVELHSGALQFKKQEERRLLVATGALGGKYYNVGKTIQLLLEKRRIRRLRDVIQRGDMAEFVQMLLRPEQSYVRIVHTDGSLENARLLQNGRTLAIMQYDVALAARLRSSKPVYTVDLPADVEFATLPNLRRIAALHEEKLYVFVRRDKLTQGEQTLQALRGLRVCLGPENSGTHVIAEAVLQHHEIAREDIISSYLPVSDMVHRIHSGEIDAGFFVSGTPSQAVQTLLNDPELALLRIGSVEQARIVESAAFTPAMIKLDSAAAGLREAAPSIPTLATQAVLVTAEDLPFDVKTITAAIFEGAAFLASKGSAETEGEAKTRVRRMAEDLPSLPLHPDARAYYEEAGYLPASETWVEQFIAWLTATWRTLTILVILVTAGGAFIKLKRDRTANRFGRGVLTVPLEMSEPSAVSKLLEIQTQLLERVHRRWWQLGELDKPRWRYLHDLIEDRVRQAQEKRAQVLIGEFRQHGEDSSGEQAQRRGSQTILAQRLWQLFETGELEASQYELLMNLVQKYDPGLAANE